MKFGPETLSTQNLIVVVSSLKFDPNVYFLTLLHKFAYDSSEVAFSDTLIRK